MWVEGNLQDGVEDILNELFEFLSVIIGILGFLYIPYVLFIRPAYQRKVLKKEWWQILGHTKSDQDETEWNVRFPSLTHGYPLISLRNRGSFFLGIPNIGIYHGRNVSNQREKKVGYGDWNSKNQDYYPRYRFLDYTWN